jgi:uncharacterized integral membrane protein (TIGR00697 family)
MFDFGEVVDKKYRKRREVVFLLFAGLFLGSLAMLNILGISRLLDFSFTLFGIRVPFMVFVGVLPYPITFLCTDFISELYGKARANMVVWIGLLLNIWVLFILWIGGILPPRPEMSPVTGLPAINDPNYVFYAIRKLTFGATTASMIAYLTAQFVDVHIFHFFRNLTKGRHLWLRNNGSTLTSQLIDSVSVVLITYYYARAIVIPQGESISKTLLILVGSNYIFKMIAALLDTIPFYLGVGFLVPFLGLDPNREFKSSSSKQL